MTPEQGDFDLMLDELVDGICDPATGYWASEISDLDGRSEHYPCPVTIKIGILSYVSNIIAYEREKFLSPGAASYIKELERALCTMLPNGTSLYGVLMEPEKWTARRLPNE